MKPDVLSISMKNPQSKLAATVNDHMTVAANPRHEFSLLLLGNLDCL